MPIKDIEVRKAYNKTYRERSGNKEKAKQRIEEFKQRNPNYSKGYYARYIADNPDYYKERNVKRYGLTLEQYNQFLLSQNNCCAICKTQHHNGKGWHIDHCHKTNIIRGILCNNCNVALGHFKEDVDLMLKAIEYLQKPRKPKGIIVF